jgi:hypothetical protein
MFVAQQATVRNASKADSQLATHCGHSMEGYLQAMTMLRASRIALAVFASIWVGALGVGVTGLIDPAAAMVLGSYSAIGLGLAAAACLVAQFVSVLRRR